MSPKRKPEVDMRCCGRRLGNGYDVITRPPMVRFRWNLACRVFADAESHADDDGNVKVEPEIEFHCGGRLFQKPEIVISRPRIELFWRNLVCE